MPWEFPSSLAFSRMNAFFHRVQTIEVKFESRSFSLPSPSEEAPGEEAPGASGLSGIDCQHT